MNKIIARILDANLNRAREGLRVAEEIARMVLEHQGLQKKLKAIRHKIIALEKKINSQQLLHYRSVQTDPGALTSNPSEMDRTSLQELGRANLRRCQEACRVLEEFSKLDNRTMSKTFKKMRFQTYDVERELIKSIDHYSLRRGKSHNQGS